MVTSPSPSSKKNFFMPNHFVEHLKDTVTVKFRSSVYSFSGRCRFLQNPFSISPVAPVAPCALYFLFIPAPHDRLEACGRRRRASRGAPPLEWQQQRPLRLPEWRSVGRRRPAPPKPPEATAWPSTHLCTLQGRRRELVGAERAPCRRRARTAVPSRTGALPQPDRGFSGETVPVDQQ